jgi:hypothetical protein
MKKILFILFFFTTNLICSQTLTYSGYIYNADGSGASNVPVKVYKRTTTTTSTTVSLGNALNTDGSNDYVIIPKPTLNSFTIEYWVKTTQTSLTGSQWYQGSGIVDAEVGGATSDFGTVLLNNKLAFGVGQPDVTIQSTTSINTGVWTHIAATWDGTTGIMKLYINGVLESTGNGATGVRSAPPSIRIGSIQTGINYFNGSIDELRIWNVVRSSTDIQSNMSKEISSQTGLVSYYKFNQGLANGSNSGQTSLTDSSGNNNTGTLYNFSLSGTTSNWVDGLGSMLSVKTYSTHSLNGSSTQYPQYANSSTDMDKMVNTSYSNTVLRWSGSLAATTCLNWNTASTLTNSGVTLASTDYFSVDITGTFVPAESGSYSFGITSDDGSDLLINGNVVTSQYGGHGMGSYSYGSINLIAGTSYSFRARMQEFGGGEGLIVVWKRPSQSTYSLQTSELGGATTTSTTTTNWVLNTTVNTNSSGNYTINRPTISGDEWYFQIDAPTPTTALQNGDAYTANSKAISRTFTSLDYYKFDVNNDGQINISDTYYIFMKKIGRFTTWYTPLPNIRIFTPTEYNTINSSTTDLRTTYPGVQSVTITSPVSGGSSNYYLINTGYSNTTSIGY